MERDSCVSAADCAGVAGACSYGACLGPACGGITGTECGPGEECVRLNELVRHCLPARCGCTGPLATGMTCDLASNTCLLEGYCTEMPCDGTVSAECNLNPPDPLPPDCRCPMCDWNFVFCHGYTGVQICPDGFTCQGLGDPPLPPLMGQSCACDSDSCQTP